MRVPVGVFQMKATPPLKTSKLAPRFKLWLSSGSENGVFGDGKWRLLQAIEEQGSLRAATVSLGISYRKAWGDLKKAELCLGSQLLERYRGGPGGGGARLTPSGKKWLAAYRQFRSQIERAVCQAFDRHIVNVAERT